MEQPKKTSTLVWVILLAFGCIGIGVLITVGKGMGYSGVALGFLGAAGSGALLVKGPPNMRKAGIGGALFGVFFVILGFMGAAENRAKEAAATAAAEAAQRKADADKAQHEKLVGQLAALDATTAPNQLVTVCTEVMKLGAVPAAQMGRCGDAFLAEGQAQLTTNHPAEAVALLESAAKMSSKGDEARAALATAKDRAEVAQLVFSARARLEKAKTAETFDEKTSALGEAKAKVDAALSKSPADVDAKALRKSIVGQQAALRDRAKQATEKAKQAGHEQQVRELMGSVFEDAALKAGFDVRVNVEGGRLTMVSEQCRSNMFTTRLAAAVGGDTVRELREAKFTTLECFDPITKDVAFWKL